MFIGTALVQVLVLWRPERWERLLWGKRLAGVDEYSAGNKMFFSITSESASNLENVGARVASMLVCQPPIFVMQVSMSCFPNWKPDPKTAPVDKNGHFVLKTKDGITIRHLVEAAKTTRDLHWQHRSDYPSHRNSRRLWPDGVEFETIITLERDDSLFERGMDELAAHQPYFGLSTSDRIEHENDMGMYFDCSTSRV